MSGISTRKSRMLKNIARGCFLLSSIFSVAAGAETIENDAVKVEIDDRGRVVALIDKQRPGVNLVGDQAEGFWRLNLQRGTSFENMVHPDAQAYTVSTDGRELKVVVPAVKLRETTLPISITFRVTLAGNEVHWQADVVNRSDYTISEVYLPEIGGLAGLQDSSRKDDLYWPEGLGRRIADFKSTMHPRQDLLTLDTAVNALQDPFLEMVYPYPATMAWTTLNNGKQGLYFAAHDSTALTGSMRAGVRSSAGGGLFFSYAKFPFVKPGENWTSPVFVVAPYSGNWHVAADKYRKFLATWRRPREKPEWVRNMQGMFLVIMRQQYGDVMWRYQDLPFLYEQARANGLDTVALFGWTAAGHDNKYPEVESDPEMGGDAALTKGLADVASAGGNSILYLQGHLIDPNSTQYPDAVEKYAAKNIWGTPYYEFYSKASESSFMRNFSHKSFTPACPTAPGWTDLMKANGERVLGDYHPTGLIYDQIGGMPPYPCFNKGLDDSPAAAFMKGRRQLLGELRSGLRAVRPDAGFMVEHPTDVFSENADIIHCWGFACQTNPEAFPELFRYTLPDVIVTSRHAALRPDRAQVNYAFTYGMRFELELRYRLEADALRSQAKPETAGYLRSLSELRKRHWEQLGNGQLLDSSELNLANNGVRYAFYGNGNSRALVGWNPGSAPLTPEFGPSGYKVVSADGVSGKVAEPFRPLQPQEVRVWALGRSARN